MQPARAIGITLVGTIILLVFSSFVTNNGKDVVSHRICPIVLEAQRQCKLPPQDRKKSAAIEHASTGSGMIRAVREMVSDAAIISKCKIDPSEISRLCQKYRLAALQHP